MPTSSPSSSPRPIIGVTGAIGGGKSTVARMLAELGCVVSDSDADARAVLDEPDVRARLVDWWGPEVLGPEGQVSRAVIAARVFADPEALRRLEALVHPRVRARRDAAFAAAPPSAPALVMDVPLLFEVGMDAECDVVIFVDAPHEIRRDRTVRDRGWSEDELDRREASQGPLDAKRARADHVLVNAGGRDELRSAVQRLLARILHPQD